jgi:hypothetical protein
MRGYVLTERERKILKMYVEENVKLDGFSVLVLRLKRSSKNLFEDVELIKEALKKIEE